MSHWFGSGSTPQSPSASMPLAFFVPIGFLKLFAPRGIVDLSEVPSEPIIKVGSLSLEVEEVTSVEAIAHEPVNVMALSAAPMEQYAPPSFQDAKMDFAATHVNAPSTSTIPELHIRDSSMANATSEMLIDWPEDCLAGDMRRILLSLIGPALILAVASFANWRLVQAGWPLFIILCLGVFAGTLATITSNKPRAR